MHKIIPINKRLEIKIYKWSIIERNVYIVATWLDYLSQKIIIDILI